VAVLGVVHHLVDVHGHLRQGWVLRVLGRNAIVVYVVSELAGAAARARVAGRPLRGWVTDSVLAPVTGPSVASVAFSCGLLALLWVVCWALWRRRMFVRV
jgi:predicted acyltransferase